MWLFGYATGRSLEHGVHACDGREWTLEEGRRYPGHGGAEIGLYSLLPGLFRVLMHLINK